VTSLGELVVDHPHVIAVGAVVSVVIDDDLLVGITS
jgi:hypothetical protein